MSNLFQKIIGNVTTRIMFIIYVSIIFITAFFIVFGYINQVNIYEKEEYEKLSALASSLAINIDGDQHQKIFDDHPWIDGVSSVDQDPNYFEIFSMLHEVQEENELNNALYTIVYNEEEDVFYYGVRSDSFMDFRHKYEVFPEVLIEKMDIGGTIPRYKSENGEWLSAFHPVKDSEGKTVALLEADVEFGHFRTMIFDLYKRQALISLGVIVLMALFLIPYARKILNADEKLKQEMLDQAYIIEQKNRDISDSINYARKIQEALLPNVESISNALPKSFIFYRPKDVVSGDFYWFEEKGDKILLAAVDCTGHGVPGALMSMIGHSKLNAIVAHDNTSDPGEILTQLDVGVSKSLGINKADHESKDGMDISLCCIDPKNKSMQYAGAFRPLLKISNGELSEIKGDRFPIGGGNSYIKQNFKTHTLEIKEGDSYFMYSDGFPDQFGGKKDKKFMNKRFKELLNDIKSLSADQQIAELDKTLEEWRGETEQVDDILVIGFFF